MAKCSPCQSAQFPYPLMAHRESRCRKNGVLEFVSVKPGLRADGFVEVTPIDAQLDAGQLVVVGFGDDNNKVASPQ